MYFPYFRGRQYELLALKELAQGELLSKSVIPVVEPIKLSSTFTTTIKVFNEKSLQLALILNPAVGELSGDSSVAPLFDAVSSYIVPAVILGKETSETLHQLDSKGILKSRAVAVLTNRDYLDTYKTLWADVPPKFTLFPDDRQLRRTVTQNKVLFEDKFNKQEKNADYRKQEDEFFSEDHLYFREERYVGFGDYSIIGNEYVEGGFAPYAVAIHIVYFDADDNLRIRHFTSDSNEDISDVAGKFQEAVIKLARWYSDGQRRQLTAALNTLLSHAKNGYYPGLPTIKKLSIMHHLELMGRYLDGGMEK
ncbi:sce7725 family protein [Stenoxybacter acetivorans]|uniref:sce7725 family protein n=1 Tax=Stenoxybacter acetivorans TaxID=422441 RepID=UPI000562BB65|nr:sce7725 family protein [Stenoxybacter acetivorans]